jgi:hypothetical protein
MPDAIMFSGDAFVVLEPNQPEQFLTPEELLEKLKGVLSAMQDSLPRDLQSIKTVEAQAQHLMDTSCELDFEPGKFLQWYLVRLEK